VTATETKLLDFLESITPNSSSRFTPATPIFATGLFDSLALVQLVGWVEEETGAAIDPSSLDFRSEWETAGHIARFIDRTKAA
jgi:acyl carrier protein